MDRPLTTLAVRYRRNSGLLVALTEGFSEADWRHRASPDANSPAWLTGHIALYRRIAGRLAGMDIPEEPWEATVARGQSPDAVPEWPTGDVLLTRFQQAGDALATHLETMSTEDALHDSGKTFPDGTTSVQGGLEFLHLHEWFHLGQIAFIRRLTGKPSPIG